MLTTFLSCRVFGLQLLLGSWLFGQQPLAGDSHQLVSATETPTRARSPKPMASPTALKITTTSLPKARAQLYYSQTLDAAGGTPPYTFSAASLPVGLTIGSLFTTVGSLSGTPSSAGSYPMTIVVTDSLNATASIYLVLEIVPLMRITATQAPNPVVGKSYNHSIYNNAAGGVPPYTYTAADRSALPPGLSISAAGVFSGTPTAAGTFNPVIQVLDNEFYNSGCCAGQAASATYNLVVEKALSIITTTLSDGVLGTIYSATITALGGAPQSGRSWALASGTLPDGLQLSVGATSDSAVINGIPTRLGTYPFTVRVTNVGGDSITQTLSIRIAAVLQTPASLAITTISLARAASGSAYAQTLTATGGTPPYTWSSTPASPAVGLTLDAATGQIRGTPLQSGTFNFTARVSDGLGAIQTKALSLVVGSTAASLTVSVPSLTFFYQLGGVIPQSQIVFLTSSGSDASYSAQPAAGAGWLLVSPTNSSTPATLNVSVNPASLATGNYNGSILVTSSDPANAPVNLTVTLTVAAASTLNSSPARLTFPYQPGAAPPPPIPISITSSPSGAAVSVDPGSSSWLSASPSSATTPAVIFVSVNPAGLANGSYAGAISVTSSGVSNSPLAVPVALNIGGATISSSFPQLSFSYALNGSIPAPQNITITSTGTTTFTASSGSSAWLAVSPAAGTVGPGSPANLSVSVNPGSLGSGTYNGSLTISGPGITNSPQVIPVTLTITGTGTAALNAAPAQLAFTSTAPDTVPPAQTINVTTSSPAPYTVSTGSTSWLNAVPSGVSTPGTVIVFVSPSGLTSGSYTGNITITSQGASNSPLTVPVTFTVTGGSAPFAVAPTQLAFNYQLNDPAPAPQSLNITGTGPYTLNIGSNSTWLSATATTTNAPATVAVTVNPQGLTAGSYSGAITFASAGATPSTQTVAVTLTIGAASAITLTPAQLSFSTQAPTSTPLAPQTVAVGSASPSLFTASATTAWLSVQPAGGSTPGNISVTANPAGLATGSYSGSVSVTSAGAPQILPVTLRIGQSITTSTFTVSVNQVNFSYSLGSQAPSQTVALSAPQPTPFSISTGDARWLTASATRATTPATISVSISPSGLTAGSYSGTITIAALADPTNSQTINVSLILSAPSSPIFSPDGIVNSASFEPGLVPGSIATIFGRNLSSVTGIVLSGGNINESGTYVKVGDLQCPLLSVSNSQGSEQISFQVPFEIAPGSTSVEVTSRAGSLRLQGIPVFTLQPGFFEFIDNGSNAYVAAAIHTDGSLVTATSPARRGEIISIFFTGGGLIRPPVPTGKVGPVPPSLLLQPATVLLNDINCEVLFIGYAPGALGLYQLNMRIPPNAPSRLAKLVIRVAGAPSPDSLLPVQ